jgi:Zn-dependent oligopeptidase
VEKSLRRALINMLIGLDMQDAKGKKAGSVEICFKWGFNLDAEDRERISQERARKSETMERFQKNYDKKTKRKARAAKNAALSVETEGGTAESAVTETAVAQPSEDNAGLPSVGVTPPHLTPAVSDGQGDSSDED